MMWAAVFTICMPDALRGPECLEAWFEPLLTLTICEDSRPAMRRIVMADLVAAGAGAADVDAGRCEPVQNKPSGVLT